MGNIFQLTIGLGKAQKSLYKHLGIVEYDDAYVEAAMAKEQVSK